VKKKTGSEGGLIESQFDDQQHSPKSYSKHRHRLAEEEASGMFSRVVSARKFEIMKDSSRKEKQMKKM